ncbi:MAG TPA: hypothetical protein VGB45_06070 [Abditibacterium sp.]
MQTIRAKFYVTKVENYHDATKTKTGETVTLQPVVSSDPENENASFSKWTPSGSIVMSITNPGAFEFFEGGAEFYVDFSAADAAQPIVGQTE